MYEDLTDEIVSLGITVQGQREQALIAQAEIERLRRSIEGYEALRPLWAQGYTSDSAAAQATSAALASIWEFLGVDNQTDAMAKLRLMHVPG